jgi:soluble lytic murein transglycosylase-like protein
MHPTARSALLRFGILLHGNKVWFSELFSMVFMSAILIALFSFSFFILLNESIIRNHHKQIMALKAQQYVATDALERLAAQQRIATAINKAVKGSVPALVFYQLVDLVYHNSKTFGYDPLLVLAVIQVESVFQPTARGRFKNLQLSGALGLMQVKPETGREMAEYLGITITTDKDLFRPDINLAVGVAYLTKLISSFKSFKLGLLAYNQGPGVIRERLQANSPLSIEYYNRVLAKYYALKQSVDGNQ